MIETGLIYIYAPGSQRRFVGCGALVEGSYVATCRHVWESATNGAAEPPAVEIEFPFAHEGGAAVTSSAGLADECAALGGPPPDLVLLRPETIPSGVMTLQLAVSEAFETGEGYAHAGVAGRDRRNPATVRDLQIEGRIARLIGADGRRQFTGANPVAYWFTRGSSGSPVFLTNGMQLAGIVCLSEVGANQGASPTHEAFVVPGTTIRRHLIALFAKPVAKKNRIDPAGLRPILEKIGAQDVPVSDIPARLSEFIDAARARAAEPVRPSNDGAEIDAAIGAARGRLGRLDAAGARALLQERIAEEERLRSHRLLPLLRERAKIERLSFDHDAAKLTLEEITRLAPDDVWTWIDLGDLRRTMGGLGEAERAYRSAAAAARRGGNERDLSVSRDRIGDVLMALGDRAGAAAEYRAGLAIAEVLARRDPANAEWQRDLAISLVKLSEADPGAARGFLSRAVEIARGLEAAGRLAPADARLPADLARRIAALKP
ncbi:MAG: trypsin-like peptidase domain-containing protein [Rhodospirillales bacterium]|nr:trypsin-like peptidase domain-containing protein [Rhodospirillales bacterium]